MRRSKAVPSVMIFGHIACAICRDQTRHDRVCIVAEPTDVQALERTGVGGAFTTFCAVRSTARDRIHRSCQIASVRARRKNTLAEAVLALNPDVTGETTMLYIEQRLKEIAPAMVITRLARGLPMGSDLRYADEITLGSALKHRTRT